MVIPGDGETQREENSSRIWVIPAAAGLRNKREKPQTLGKLVCTQFVFAPAGCLCVAERAPDETQCSDVCFGREEGTQG